MKRSLLILIALLAAACFVPGSALAYATGTPYPLIAVDNSAGDQSQPHVSGRYASYNVVSALGANTIGYFDFATQTNSAIAQTSDQIDGLSDIFGNTIVFTRISISGGTSGIFSFPIGGTATEVAPVAGPPGAQRNNPAIGGPTIAWEDIGVAADMNSEIVVSSGGSVTRLTTDPAADQNPSVSPDGSTVVWEKCTTNCDVYAAVKSGGLWSVSAVAATSANETSPDTNGSVVVYASNSGPNGLSQIHVRSLIGGADQTIPTTVTDANHPAISGSSVVYEGGTGTQHDIFVYDLANGSLYQITNTPQDNELLADIDASTTAGVTTVRVVWQVFGGASGYDVYGSQFVKAAPDTIPPTLSLPGPISVPATGPAGAVVSFSATATDNLDPNPSVSCTPASGSTFAIGNTTVSCTATDAAGNTASGSFTVHVKSASEQIVDLVNKTLQYLGLPALSAPLQMRLQSASAALIAGNKTAACAALNLYLAAVQAASGKSLTAAQANDLIADAQRIKAVIGC